MNWRFWRRASKKNARGRAGNSIGIPTLGGAEDVSVVEDHFPNAPGLRLSSRELLGLQRIIGNQAVVQMLKPKE